MTSRYSIADRERILGESRELLQRLSDATDTRHISEPTRTLLDILAQPCEHPNDRIRRELAARDTRWAEQRAERETTEAADAMSALEVRLIARIASQGVEQRGIVFEMISEAFDV